MSGYIKSLCVLLAACGLWGAAAAQAADAFPKSPIKLVVPYSPGGPSDALARALAQSMSQSLGQTVSVENLPGKGGTIGTLRVAKAPADGYTLLFHHIGQAVSPLLYRWLPYNVTQDFVPVGLVGDLPMMLVARKDLPPRSLGELIEYMKKEKVVYADAGLGSASHLCGMLFMRAVGKRLNTESFDGTGPAMRELADGQVDLMCDQTANTLRPLQAGKIKAYAVTSGKRLPSLPGLPTAYEAGLKDFEILVWNAVYAPQGTPKAAIDSLAKALQAAVADEALTRKFAELGATPATQSQASPEALRGKLLAELQRWGGLIPTFRSYRSEFGE